MEVVMVVVIEFVIVFVIVVVIVMVIVLVIVLCDSVYLDRSHLTSVPLFFSVRGCAREHSSMYIYIYNYPAKAACGPVRVAQPL